MEREGGKGSASEISDSNTDSRAWIFLSHSGSQKLFARELYKALLSVKHRPFFDEDTDVSLPTCNDYPSRIFQACAACRMGVVVLSESYVKSLWPMVELQHFLQNKTCKVYPVFYDLQPSDLSNAVKLASWEECWAKRAAEWQWDHKMQEVQGVMRLRGCDIHINLDRSTWAKYLRMIQYTSGEVCQEVTYINGNRTFVQRSEHEVIQAVVSKICRLLPPPYPMDKTLNLGGECMQRMIADVFNKNESLGADGVRAVGVHGIGGSGKTTLCKGMAAFYNDEFGGRCYHLEFPSLDNEVEVEKLLGNIKAILPSLTLHLASTLDVPTIDEAMHLLEEGMQKTKVFLAMDNVWSHSTSLHLSFKYAERIMLIKFMLGSKILVTGRSKEVLKNLLQRRLSKMQDGNVMNTECSMRAPSSVVVHIPSLSQGEAVELLKFYSRPFSCSFRDQDEWRSLADTCMFEERYHPLRLKLMGNKLEMIGRPGLNDTDYKALFLSLKKEQLAPNSSTEEGRVWRDVERSFNDLPFHLQGIFIDLATARHYLQWLSRRGVKLWNILAELCSDQNYTANDIFRKVLELEYHGLLELKYHDDDDLEIHDLYRKLAYSKVSHPCHASNALINNIAVVVGRDLSHEILVSKKFVIFEGGGLIKACKLIGGSSSPRCLIPAQTQVLCLGKHQLGFVARTRRSQLKLNLESGRMKALRVLMLRGIGGVTELDGWEGVPHLVRLELENLPDLRRIGLLGCLSTRLETLIIADCRNLEVYTLVDDDQLQWKRKRNRSRGLVKVGDYFPELQVLELMALNCLVELGPAFCGTFPALEILRLNWCSNLEVYTVVGDDQLQGQRNMNRSRGLVKVGDRFPKLQVLELIHVKYLVELGAAFCDTFPALETVGLSWCDRLERLPKLGRSLRSLDLSYCSMLKSIFEGGEYESSALQYLNLWGCKELERLPDLSNVEQLRTLDVGGGVDLLDEVRLRLRISACEHLTSLALPTLNCRATDASECSTSVLSLLANAVLCDVDRTRLLMADRDGIKAFSNLRLLMIAGTPTWKDNTRMRTPVCISCRRLDVSGLPSLEELSLVSLKWVQELSISLSSLVKLRRLRVTDVPILQEISLDGDHGAHHHLLDFINIQDCPKLKIFRPTLAVSLSSLEFWNCAALEDVSNLSNLATSLPHLALEDCPALADVSIVAALTSLRTLKLERCTALRGIPDLKHLPSLERLDITDPGACWMLTEDAVLQV